jgi:Spy/CpxP family protein refolding chaperone
MQTKRFKALILGAVFLLVTGALAFAHGPGGGYGGGHGGYGMQDGECPRMMENGGQGMGPGMMGHGRKSSDLDLSKEQQDKLDEARERFWSENRKLRRDIADKRDELYDELGKKTTDEARVTALQKELSKLESDFDQKTIQHKLEVHKIAPEIFKGHGYGRMHGGGRN